MFSKRDLHHSSGFQIAMIMALLGAACSPAVDLPLTIDGCPTQPVLVGEAFELSVTHAQLSEGGFREFSWTLYEGSVEIVDVSPPTFTLSRIAVTPLAAGRVAVLPSIVFTDAHNVARPAYCSFGVLDRPAEEDSTGQ